MSKLCRISIVGLHLLLLTHITHSFVLLTANVEDIKKIARKFVSDSLAERISNFLARATETLVMNSEETKTQESSQVSAENRMYSAEKTNGNDNIRKTKELTDTPRSLNTENEKHKEVEYTAIPRSQNRNAKPKILHGRSRYIEPVKRAKSTENNVSVKINKTKHRFKLLSTFDTNMTTIAATTGIPTVADKAKIDKKLEKKTDNKPSEYPKRSVDAEIAAGRESDYYDTDKESRTVKAVNEFDQTDVAKNKNSERNVNKFDQYDISRNKNTETEGTSAPMSEEKESVNEINNIIQRDEKVVTRGSLVKEKDLNDDKWWEKELTTRVQYDADIQAEGKSWF